MDIRVKDIIKDNSIWLPSQDYNEKKKLSILMPTYGRGKNGFFKRAVTSYIEQTFKDTELIIVDDANVDGTSEQIDEFMKQDKRISCIRHKKNMGLPAVSTYEALKKARGEYIGFLFDDCVLYPSAYERTLEKMEEEGAQASYGRVLLHIDKNNLSKSLELYCKEEHLDNLEITNLIGNIAIVFKKDILETVGYFDPHVCLTRVRLRWSARCGYFCGECTVIPCSNRGAPPGLFLAYFLCQRWYPRRSTSSGRYVRYHRHY